MVGIAEKSISISVFLNTIIILIGIAIREDNLTFFIVSTDGNSFDLIELVIGKAAEKGGVR